MLRSCIYYYKHYHLNFIPHHYHSLIHWLRQYGDCVILLYGGQELLQTVIMQDIAIQIYCFSYRPKVTMREKKKKNCQPKEKKRKAPKLFFCYNIFIFFHNFFRKKSLITYQATGSKKTLILAPMSKKMLYITLRNRGKPFNIQHVTGLVNMGMSDTASGKHGSNKRGLQYKKAA